MINFNFISELCTVSFYIFFFIYNEHFNIRSQPPVEIFLKKLLFLDNIFNDESLENRQVPQIDEEESKTATTEEDARFLREVLKSLIVHPKYDKNSDEESQNIDVGVDDKLQRVFVFLGDDVEYPGLVRHGVKLCDEGQHGKSKWFLGDERSRKTDDHSDVVNGEKGKLTDIGHVQNLCNVDTERKDYEVDSHLRGAVH